MDSGNTGRQKGCPYFRLQDAIIVRSTISLANNLKLNVIAEGVEDAETLKMLEQIGCD